MPEENIMSGQKMHSRYFYLPPIDKRYINRRHYFLLFETSLCDSDNFMSYIFTEPVEVIKLHRYKDLPGAFKVIESYSQKYYLAGYFSYELGYYFENFQSEEIFSYPLIYLCVFNKAVSFNHQTGKITGNAHGLFCQKPERSDFSIKDMELGIKKQKYIKKINQILSYIKQGETYQVNFTSKYYFRFTGSAFSLYEHLKERQLVSYSAFCKLHNDYIISLSPELFFRREGSKIWCQPMKGTIKRGRTNPEDREMAMRLQNSPKDRSENLMIVDLIRNDLGRICRIGSIKAPHLFRIEKYKTLHQMTSTVKGLLRNSHTYFDIFKALFPGGSVTGAPKIRTMQIIRELEEENRNIYCGALGIIFPEKKAVLNLPIRTISLIKNRGEMGVGSGITFDSDGPSEFEECLLKAKFLTEKNVEFSLLETILWMGRYVFLKEHLKRLSDSAKYFEFEFNQSEFLIKLKAIENKFNAEGKYRLRLLLSRQGDISLEYTQLPDDYKKERYIAVSRERINSDNLFYYHKTTNRVLYDSEYARYYVRGFFDVIFLNRQNEVTEGAISNIIIQQRGRYYTPPISSGLLPGIYRNSLLKKGAVQEKCISLNELYKADRIFLCNSVRGLTEVKLTN